MKKVFFLVLLVLIVGVSVYLVLGNGISLSRSNDDGPGLLTIRYPAEEVSVYIDDSYIGNTPVENYSIESGSTLVTVGESWEEQVEIAEGATSQIFREQYSDGAISYGYSIGYKKAHSWRGNKVELVVVTSQSGSTISIDGESIGTTPITIKDKPEGIYSVTVEHESFEPQTIEVELLKDYVTTLTVDLLFAPLHGIEEISIEGLPDVPASNLDLVGRYQWGGVPISELEISLVPSEWSQLKVWGGTRSEFDESNSSYKLASYLQSMDVFIREHDGDIGIPFAYIIDSDGTVYEGMGLFDLDYSQFSSLTIEPGIVPVLVLGNNIETLVTENVLNQLGSLKNYIQSIPTISAERSSESTVSEELEIGGLSFIDVEWRNASSYVWQGSGTKVQVVATASGTFSELYDPELWASTTVVGGVGDQVVYPGDVFKFSVPVRAPYFPSEVSETFMLKDVAADALIPNTDIIVSVKASGENVKALEILDTPTGFLNVRREASIGSELITTVFPGEKFAWIESQDGWYRIIMKDGNRGWITSKYAREF